MYGVVQQQRHSYIDSIAVLDFSGGLLSLNGPLNHCPSTVSIPDVDALSVYDGLDMNEPPEMDLCPEMVSKLELFTKMKSQSFIGPIPSELDEIPVLLDDDRTATKQSIGTREVDGQRAWHFGQHFGCLDSCILNILVSNSSDRQHDGFW